MQIHPKKLEQILSSGHLAPSADNSQPWLFEIENNVVNLHHDLARASSNHLYNLNFFADYVSLGTVIENLELAASQAMLQTTISLLPSAQAQHIAKLEFTQVQGLKKNQLARHIPLRKTNRRKFQKRALPAATLTKIQELAAKRGGTLVLIEDQMLIKQFAKIIALHDHILWEDAALRENLVRMLRNKNIYHEDGLPLSSLELGIKKHLFAPAITLAQKIPLLWKALAIGSANHTKNVIKNSGALGILILPQEHKPQTFVEGGRIFQSIWLSLTSSNIHVQPIFGSLALIFNQQLNIGGLSPKHAKIQNTITTFFENQIPQLKHGTPVALFRMGHARKPSVVSGRRKLQAVLRKKTKLPLQTSTRP